MTTSELLELRTILQLSQIKNNCIECGLCCRISGKFFIKLEKDRLSNRFSSLLFKQEDNLDVIRVSDDLPWCLGASDPVQIANYHENEQKILNSQFKIDDAPKQPWFHETRCQVYEERPILCRLYPYNINPSYCMVGKEFLGNDLHNNARYLELMTKYLYVYRLECFNDLNIDLKSWNPVLTKETIIPQDYSLILKNQKSNLYMNSIWNLWGFMRKLLLIQDELNIIKACTGNVSAYMLSKDFVLPNKFVSWNDFWKDLLILEIIEFPVQIQTLLLKGIIRF